ncbi:MAG: GNAT family N-acetyltransferase [Gemmatimonadetes bacterium]|nr:GNAT family N-acetyltransferase [Gemmatimonadota bacterium]
MAAVADAGNDALVGCIFLRSARYRIRVRFSVPGGYVTNSYVAPSHRDQGLGGRLLGVVIAAARERKHEFLIVWPSDEAVSFYTRAGFQEAAEAHRGPSDYPPLEFVLS